MASSTRRFRVHKSRGTCKIVEVHAERVEVFDGVLSFWRGDTLVMSYAPWAWKSVSEEGGNDGE